ncbi:MAG: hypothetical protein ACTSYI_17530 [Promethearchaeota archaeon]
MIIKCPHCSNSKLIKQIDQKRELGLMICLRCNKYFEVVNPPSMIRSIQSKLDIPGPRFKIQNNETISSPKNLGSNWNVGIEGNVLSHFLSSPNINRNNTDDREIARKDLKDQKDQKDQKGKRVQKGKKIQTSRKIIQSTLPKCLKK